MKLMLVLSLLSGRALSFYAFSSSSCEACVKRINLVRGLNPEASFITYEISESDNLKRFNEIVKALEVEYVPLPLIGVFDDGKLNMIVAGGLSEETWKNITEVNIGGVSVYIDDGKGQVGNRITVSDEAEIKKLEELFTGTSIEGAARDFNSLFLPVMFAAALDAVNPCAFSVLLVLLTLVFYSVNRRSVLSTGLTFSGAVFITYFLMGLGLIRIIGYLPLVKYAVAAFILSVGILGVVEFFSGERKHLPNAFSKQITKYIERTSGSRTGFVAGVVTASLLLPCSSAPYFFALNLLSERATLLGGLALLAIYNLIIVTPLVIITTLIHVLGVTTMDLKLWVSEKRRWINLLVAIGLICLGVILLT